MSSKDRLLSRRVEKVLPDAEGLAELMDERKIRLYNGIDPTGSRLHLGHSIPLRKLMEFAEAGHEVILLFGTGTVLVGDPSLRDSARELITEDEIDENIKTWKQQASKIIDFDQVEIRRNGDWIRDMKIQDLIEVGSQISATQLFKRDSFTRRIEQGQTVWYHETMYPLLQGYDSVVMDVDLEIGGTDQEFNMLVGRELQQKMNDKEKWVLTVPMIVGTDGQPMSKSKGNCVWLDDSPQDMFGKLMSLPDEHIWSYLRLVTDVPQPEIDQLKQQVESGLNPKEAKTRLAKAVVTMYHTESAAKEAEAAFERQFSEGKLPEDIEAIELDKSDWELAELLVELELTDSKSQARRLQDQGGVRINQDKVDNQEVSLNDGDVVQVGKRRFRKVVLGK